MQHDNLKKRKTERKTDRQTDRQKERKKERERKKENKETETYIGQGNVEEQLDGFVKKWDIIYNKST